MTTCGICGTSIIQKPKGRKRRFCEGECSRTAKNQMTQRWRDEGSPRQVRTCLECGAQWCNLARRGNRGLQGRRKFCSTRCSLRFHERSYRINPKHCKDCASIIEPLPAKDGKLNIGSRVRCTPCQDSWDARRNSFRIPKPARLDVYDRDRWVCQLCHEPIDRAVSFPHPRAATIDHITPRSLGGNHEPWNLQTAHWECNRAKRTNPANEQMRLAIHA